MIDGATRSMRILVHDYSGHPFQVQLSRSLAARGHEVLHVHCSSYQTGKGAVDRRDDDPANFSADAIDLGRTFDRYNVARRVTQELSYGKAFSRRAAEFRPEIIVSSNDPLFAKARAARWCRRSQVPWVFWLQDIYSVAMAGFASAKLGVLGRVIGGRLQSIERRLLTEADDVVMITEDFRPVLSEWGIPDDRGHVIENWAPIEELDVRPKRNPWSVSQQLDDRRVLLYSGTLGLKHDPGRLVELAERFRGDEDVRIVVISEGAGADWLAVEKDARRLSNLVLLPYQPFEELPDVLGTADVLLALLAPDAGVFSVPSKILTYLCAGRALLAAMPLENLGARTIERAGAGMVVAPDDSKGWLKAADRLVGDAGKRQTCGEAARLYAEQAFAIDHISGRFEAILAAALERRERAP